MYAAKARGKNCYEVYQPALQVAVSERLERTAELQRAVDEEQFVLHYQPIVSLDGGNGLSPGGAHPVAAPRARPGARRTSSSPWPKRRASSSRSAAGYCGRPAARRRSWQHEHGLAGRLRVSVNISARHFQHEGLIEDVSEALRASQLDPACLVLEITESLLVHDAEAVIARMLELKALGVAFAVDDFGTGYSSLSYLKRFPIDILKVDKSFVDDVGDSDQGSGAGRGDRAAGPVAQPRHGGRRDREAGARSTGCAPWAATTGKASFLPGRWRPTKWTSSCP